MLCQLLYKVKSLYFYYKSTRKKLKLHAQGETQTHRHGVYRNTELRKLSCCLSLKPTVTESSAIRPPTTYSTPALLPVSISVSKHCQQGADQVPPSLHSSMSTTDTERWKHEPVSSSAPGKEPEWRGTLGTGTSAAETIYNPVPKEHVLACSHVGSGLLTAAVRNLQWWLSQFSSRHRKQMLSSELAGRARGGRIQLLRPSHRCNTSLLSPCFSQPCGLHTAQENLHLIYSAQILLWLLGGAGHLNIGVENSATGGITKPRVCTTGVF